MRNGEMSPHGHPVYPDLDGKCAVVVGGAGGLGSSAALGLARNGCRVAVLDLPGKHEQSKEVVQQITGAAAIAVDFPCDVLDVVKLETAFEEVRQALGPPRVLVNSAGVVLRKPALDVTEEDWDRVVDVCLRGTFFAAQVAARHMRESGGGSIINVSSIFGTVAGRNRVAYGASKAGVLNATKVLAVEWQPYGIRVNAVAPTFVRTPMTEALLSAELDVVNKSLIRPLAEPEDVSSAITFLASDVASGMITGQSLAVDGGWTTW